MSKDKQLQFAYMYNTIQSVTTLGYIGGQDEDLGGYCEPLIIKYEDGMSQFVLHQMWQGRELDSENEKLGKIVNHHEKIIFKSQSELLGAWKGILRYCSQSHPTLNWEKTNAVCGCDATCDEFYKTKRMEKKVA